MPLTYRNSRCILHVNSSLPKTERNRIQAIFTMYLLTNKRIVPLIISAYLLVPIHASIAEEDMHTNTILQTATFRWNNENWFTEAHPRVIDFTVRDDGSAYGTLETGVPFLQENIENELGLRIQRFVLQDHYHYIINGTEVYTLEDFSIQLAQASGAPSQSAT
jgi:hypothetical protein